MNEIGSLLSEVRMATLGVSQLDRAVQFYKQALAYRCIERGPVDQALAPLWQFEPDQALEYAVMAADDSGRGRIRLVAGEHPGRPIWTRANRMTATGSYALNFRCRDIHEQLQRIGEAGGEAAGRPHFWEVNDEVHVYDSMSADPDGTQLDLFSYARGGDLRGALETPVSVIQTVALAVADVEASGRFYKAMGFVELFDRVLDFDGLGDMLGVDRPVKIHNVNLMKDGRIVPGRVEMFSYLDSGLPPPQPVTATAVPPNLGLLSFSLLTTDAEAVTAALEALGGRRIGRAENVSVPGFGRVGISALLGPDGERIELIDCEALPDA